MTVPAYEKIRDFFPSFVDFYGPVVGVVASFCAQDLTDCIPVGDIDVCPCGGFGFGKRVLRDADEVLDVFLDGEDVGGCVKAAEERRIVRRGGRRKSACEERAGVLVVGLVEGSEDVFHGGGVCRNSLDVLNW